MPVSIKLFELRAGVCRLPVLHETDFNLEMSNKKKAAAADACWYHLA